MSHLEGRHAVITGGASGIGAAVATALADAGGRVTVMGRDPVRLERFLATCPGARSIICDVTDEGSIGQAFAQARIELGPVDILVNNAGAVESASFQGTDVDMLDRMLAVNTRAVLVCTNAVLPAMIEAGWGRIITVASTAGLKGYPYIAAYAAAKHAAIGLMRALAMEVAAKGVTANAVCPGYTDTEMVSQALDDVTARPGKTREEVLARYVAGNPQGRLVEPEEVADTVLWLAGDGASAINGQAIAIAGGEVG